MTRVPNHSFSAHFNLTRGTGKSYQNTERKWRKIEILSLYFILRTWRLRKPYSSRISHKKPNFQPVLSRILRSMELLSEYSRNISLTNYSNSPRGLLTRRISTVSNNKDSSSSLASRRRPEDIEFYLAHI